MFRADLRNPIEPSAMPVWWRNDGNGRKTSIVFFVVIFLNMFSIVFSAAAQYHSLMEPVQESQPAALSGLLDYVTPERCHYCCTCLNKLPCARRLIRIPGHLCSNNTYRSKRDCAPIERDHHRWSNLHYHRSYLLLLYLRFCGDLLSQPTLRANASSVRRSPLPQNGAGPKFDCAIASSFSFFLSSKIAFTATFRTPRCNSQIIVSHSRAREELSIPIPIPSHPRGKNAASVISSSKKATHLSVSKSNTADPHPAHLYVNTETSKPKRQPMQ